VRPGAPQPGRPEPGVPPMPALRAGAFFVERKLHGWRNVPASKRQRQARAGYFPEWVVTATFAPLSASLVIRQSLFSECNQCLPRIRNAHAGERSDLRCECRFQASQHTQAGKFAFWKFVCPFRQIVRRWRGWRGGEKGSRSKGKIGYLRFAVIGGHGNREWKAAQGVADFGKKPRPGRVYLHPCARSSSAPECQWRSQ